MSPVGAQALEQEVTSLEIAADTPEAADAPAGDAAQPAPEPAAETELPAEEPAVEPAPESDGEEVTPSEEPAPETEAPAEPEGDTEAEPLAVAEVSGTVTVRDASQRAVKAATAVGTKLTATSDVQAPEGLEVDTAVEWYVDGALVPSTAVTTAGQFTTRTQDLGRAVTARAVTTWAAGEEFAAGSATLNSAPTVVKQQAKVSAATKVSGTPKVGNKLTASTTKLSKPAGFSLKRETFTWYANGKKVSTGKTYTVRAGDYKKRITAKSSLTWNESKTLFAGSVNAKTSASTAKVAKQTAKVSTKISVSGHAKPGSRLVAKGSVSKPKDLKVTGSYRWWVSGRYIGGGSVLKITPSMVGKKITVSYTAKWGNSKYASSSKSASKSYRGFTDRPGKMVRSARAQLGAYQDCTALIERALRSSGVKAGDLGTRTGEYTALGGKRVSAPQPGDVFIWEGRHVAMYIGNGKAVHSGFAGNQTVIASAYIEGSPSAIVRFV
ncbi:NlpC/P60 family protein [Leucobacter chromiireducens]|uniref:NlpC/P60 family protein n=1 Tax=Leucobacter chromiireducens TaxID=283877 RepID=UPI000F63309B|nr:NlpC/P60 family protein [Leucobacter chromiireducens]